MLKFLVDESSGKKLADALKNNGYDSVYVGDFLLGANDEKILEASNKEKRIVITNDKDFGELIFRHKNLSSGIILLRLKNNIPVVRISTVFMLIKKFGINLKRKFIVASEDKIRIKTL